MLPLADSLRRSDEHDIVPLGDLAIEQGPLCALTQEQQLLDDIAHRFVSENCRFDSRRVASPASSKGFDPLMWRRFAEMGWLGVTCPEEHGVADGSMVDICILMRHFGRGLVNQPLLPTVILGASILAQCGSPEQRSKLLPALVSGNLQLAVGFLEPRGGYDPSYVETTAICAAGTYTISGHKAVVLNAPAADQIIVSARTTGAPNDPFGISLFLIPADAPGLELRPYTTIDGRSAAEVVLKDVRISCDARIGKLWDGLGILERVIDDATLACASEALGALEAAIEMTIDYLGTREQFGKKLSTFQVLRHRVVDLYVVQEELRSLIFWATRESDAASRKKAISACKILIGEQGTRAMLDTIQLHGAIGMTEAFPVGHYVRRFTAIDRMFGGAAEHIERYSAC